MKELEGKTVLVAGASAGVGAGIARRLAGLGAEVHAIARRGDRLEDLAREVAKAAEGRRSGRIVPHAADLASAEDVERLFARLTGDGVVPDRVVNAAAVLWLGPFVDQPEEHWQRMIAVNLSGSLRLVQHALRAMLPRGSGQFLQITSTAVSLALPQLAVYSATKAALSHFLRAMRGEHGATGIRFTELEIGNTRGTEGGGSVSRATPPLAIASLSRWTGLPETLSVDEVVDAALWALSTPDHVRLDRLTLRERGAIPV